MMMRRKLLLPFVAFAAILSVSTLLAQQPAAPTPAQPAIEAVAAPDPFGGEFDNPAVRAALEWPRNNPLHAFRAVLALIDLGRPELAKPILEELHARGLDGPTQAALVDEFGSHRMLQLSRIEAIQPVGTEFSTATMASAATIATDPARLAQLVAQLSDPAPDVRLAAVNDLMAAGRPGVKAVLESLARESDSQRQSDLIAAAVRMRPLVDGPMLAMLETNDARLQVDVTKFLGQLQVRQALPLIAGPNSPISEPAILHALEEYEMGVPPFAADAENQIELWFWNDATKSLTAARYPADAARVIWMARLARRLVQLRPDNAAYRRKAVLLGAEASGLSALGSATDGNGVAPVLPVSIRWSALDVHLVNEVLADALKSEYAYAAVAASDELGRRGQSSVLLTADAKPSPLASALTHGDRRVRFAALRAIMMLDPTSPFPGSSRVPEALTYFARSAGEREALVAMPKLESATDLAGKLAVANLHGEATIFGSDLPKMAAQMADLELILVDSDIQLPGIRQVLYELRITPASAQVPIAVLAADGRLEAAEKLASEHERVIAVPRPHSADMVAAIAGRLLSSVAHEAVSADVRAQQSLMAITWTAGLLERGRSFYALRRESPAIESAMYQPATAASAIDALARFGRPSSQRALMNFASHRTLPIDARTQAAAAFDASVRASGLLLTTDEIRAQYAIYNASAAADADTQQVLGALLDSIESRRTNSTAATNN